MNRSQLEQLVREVVKDVVADAARGAAIGVLSPPPATSQPACDLEVCAPRRERPRLPHDAQVAREVVQATPARVLQGRTGTRYLTATAIGVRAEHAIALDAVHSRVPDGFAAKLGCIELRSRCTDPQHFLLYPDAGRRLDDASKAKLVAEGTRGADVQVIAGDGLSALALTTQGPQLLPALDAALRAQGFSTGKPLLVHFARIGVQDEIGVLLGSKSTVILVGERPGLGTGDSLSIYTAFGPRLQQDNAEKNCISNVRAMGIPPVPAAEQCAQLMKRTFAAGRGGIHLVSPVRDIVRRS